MKNKMPWKEKARQLKTEIFALYLASRHPRVPWHAKIFTTIIIGYALSPVDLIPDFIPVLGYLDDLIIIPAGIFLSLKMIPEEVLIECRDKAKSEFGDGRPKNWLAAVIIVLIWLLVAYLVLRSVLNVVF